MSTDIAQVIGIDLGGTAIKLGRFGREGQCLQSLSVPTPQPPLPEAVVEVMVAAIAQLDPQNQAVAIGVGTPGPADARGRIARISINLGWRDVLLADLLEARVGKPVVVANDANCAAMGEHWRGAGRPFKDLILLTLGTGVGGGIILNGHLFVGRRGAAGELGLITLDREGAPCNSGNRGSLEQHVSVQAVRRRTGLEPEELGRRAQAGDPEAIAFWRTYGCELGAGLASLIYVLTPEAVIIGGGICASAGFFFPSLLEEIKTRVVPDSREDLKVLVAELGNQAGMVGAARLAWDLLDQQALPQTCQTATGLNQQLAEWLAEFKGGFLARSSHELRSPLNSVISLHQLILNDLCDSPEEERHLVQQSYEAAQRMLKLMDELIQVSKLQHGTLPLEVQPIPLVEMLEETEQMTYLQARNRNYPLQIDLPDESVYVLADPRGLRQVLVQGIEGAIAQMTEGRIHLQTQMDAAAGLVHLDLLDDRPVEAWSEAWDWLHQNMTPSMDAPPPPLPSDKPSPGMTLLVSQTLMERMGGRLELVERSSVDAPAFHLRYTLPLVPSEAD